VVRVEDSLVGVVISRGAIDVTTERLRTLADVMGYIKCSEQAKLDGELMKQATKQGDHRTTHIVSAFFYPQIACLIVWVSSWSGASLAFHLPGLSCANRVLTTKRGIGPVG
jgi:hypothetical protein